MNTIKTYDAYLSVPNMPPDVQDEVQRIFKLQGLDVDVYPSMIEFTFAGRDLSDMIVVCLQRMAEVIGTAGGEVRCEVDEDDERAPTFCFYTIRDGRLWKQTGRIVRSDPPEEVSR